LRSLIAIVAAVLLLAPAGLASTTEVEWLEFHPSVVTLTGRFELVLRFGPPNYGEDPKTDLKIEVPMLLLTDPIRVRGRPGDEINSESVEDVRMVQLILPSQVNRYELIDQEVLVRGELTHATQGPEFTAVIMDVNQIKRR
jgi:Domain of unknown function (DUF4431)